VLVHSASYENTAKYVAQDYSERNTTVLVHSASYSNTAKYVAQHYSEGNTTVLVHSASYANTAKYVAQHCRTHIFAFAWRQWLRERARMLRYTCISCLVEIADDTMTGFGLPSGIYPVAYEFRMSTKYVRYFKLLRFC
jgi:hypothetical protein